MRSSRKRTSKTVRARISTRPNHELRLSRRWLRPLRKLPAAGLLKTASGEAGGDGAVVVVDVAMDEATRVARGASGARSRVLPGLWSRLRLLLRFLVRRTQAGPSSLHHRRDTSPYFSRESRFRSTGE